MAKIRLGVNIDHVATVRNARGENYPDPLRAVQSAVDRMRDLYDIEDSQFGELCQNILNELVVKIDKS